jgi:acyl-CoA reductase-like NAD-dependent aldehyde dehydrogenase
MSKSEPPVPAAAIPNDLQWSRLIERLQSLAPEAFDSAGSPRNHVAGAWLGEPRSVTQAPASDSALTIRCFSPVDGTLLGHLNPLAPGAGDAALTEAAAEGERWSKVPLAERQHRTRECVASVRAERDLLIACLAWEIGKTQTQGANDVDRALEGVDWYIANAESMVAQRRPVGLVSNIASWNYPFSVLFHSMLVQSLAGNAVIAKVPSKGGGWALTLATAFARRVGLPLSLVSGRGAELGEVLVSHPRVDAVAFVGGRSSGRRVEQLVNGSAKRYMLEMEGVNAYGVWEFSDWAKLGAQIQKGFDFAKQRCTAYVRFVVQRKLLPEFLATYLPIVQNIRVGNPLLTFGEQPRAVDMGPLIAAEKATELSNWMEEAVRFGALPLFRGRIDPALMLPGQACDAYFAPAALLNVPRSAALYYREPFGPLDSVVVVDTREELVAEINASGGALVASIASDDVRFAEGVASELRAFKVGVNRIRSRGDREEHFGGIGKSWRGCFVGGEHLVRAVTHGEPGSVLYGNFEVQPQLSA